MPIADQYLNSPSPVRLLLYGPPKSKKTWWAANAALAGFKVLLLDADGGASIIRNVTQAARANIYVMDIANQHSRSTAIDFTVPLLKNQYVIYNENTHQVFLHQGSMNADTTFVDLRAMDSSYVLVLDSWTALVYSIQLRFSLENGVDLSDASKPDWEGFRWAGALATWVLNQLTALPCNVIVVAHSSMYEKRGKDAMGKDKIEWARRQPLSTSNPHGMTLGKSFDEIYYLYAKRQANFIEATGDQFADGGTRFLKPGTYQWDKLQFADLAMAANIPLPAERPDYTPGFVFPQFAKQEVSRPATPKPASQPGILQGNANSATPAKRAIAPAAKPKPTVLNFGKKE